MKRLLLAFLILVMILGTAACNDNKPIITPSQPTDRIDGTSEKPEETNSSELPVTATNSVSLDEQLLVDQDGVVITLKGLDFSDSYYAGKIKVLIENDSDRDINVSILAIAVNDIMVDGDMYTSVGAGKKSNEMISFYKDDFDNAGIEVIKTVDVIFDVYDPSTYDDIFISDLISMTTTGSEDYAQVYYGGDQLVFDNDGVKLVVQDIVVYENSYYGAGVIYYVENNSENLISITAGNTSVNGFMVDGGMYTVVMAGKKAYTSLDFNADELAENDIEIITEVEASYTVYDPETYEDYFTAGNIKTAFS